MPYSGEEWPKEAIIEQLSTLSTGQVLIVLLGERQDVIGIQEISTSYSFFRRYGRPFQRLYKYVVRRPEKQLVLAFEEPFRHSVYTLTEKRIELVQFLAEQRPTLIYDVIGKDTGGNIIHMGNFDVLAPEMIERAETLLKARGWSEQSDMRSKKAFPYWYNLYLRVQILKGKLTTDFHAIDRWWHENYHLWRKT